MQDDQAWNYFERAIALRPGDNEEAVNRYTEHLLAQGQASRAVQALERLTTPEQRRSSFVQALLHKRAADRAGLHSQEIDMESASVLQRFTTEPLGGYSAESFLSSSSVDTVNSNDNLASEFATVTQAATSDDSSTLFAWLSNGAIGEGELSSDNSIGTMYSFPAPPSGGVMKLVTLRLPDSGSLTDRAGLFAIGTNNIVYYRYLDGSSWGSWQSLGVSAVDLSAVVWPNGQADVFRVDTDRCNVYVSHSTDGQTWGGWNWWGACGDQIAVAVLPDSTAWAMLRTHFPAPYNLDVVVNRYFNGTSWANQWSLFPGALYGVNNMALQAHPTPLLGSIRMTFYTVDANNTTVYARVSNGPAWSDQVFWTSGFKQVSSFDTLDGGFYLLFIGTSDSQLYTERFDGSAWSGIIPQDMFWLAGTGGKYKDRHIRPKGVARAHTNVNDDCRNFASQLTCQPDPVLGGCFHPWALNLAEILFNEARFEKSGAQAMVGWTVRDRAFLSLKKVLANGSTCTSGQGCLRCDSYHGAEAGLLTGSCRAALTRKPSCTQSNYCDENIRYCCVEHGGETPLGKSQKQFNDTHVPFQNLVSSGLAHRAVNLINGHIPDPSTGFVPSGISGCLSKTDCDDPNTLLCYSGPSNLREADPSGPMEFLGYDYCARVGSGLPRDSCKWYAADECPNTDPDLQPRSACGNYSQSNSQGDNFFWNRQP